MNMTNFRRGFHIGTMYCLIRIRWVLVVMLLFLEVLFPWRSLAVPLPSYVSHASSSEERQEDQKDRLGGGDLETQEKSSSPAGVGRAAPTREAPLDRLIFRGDGAAVEALEAGWTQAGVPQANHQRSYRQAPVTRYVSRGQSNARRFGWQFFYVSKTWSVMVCVRLFFCFFFALPYFFPFEVFEQHRNASSKCLREFIR